MDSAITVSVLGPASCLPGPACMPLGPHSRGMNGTHMGSVDPAVLSLHFLASPGWEVTAHAYKSATRLPPLQPCSR